MVTLYDVARRAAVSTATVSRVVHGQDLVRESTRIRVQQAIEELGYVPDGAAQSLSRRRKDIIGMMCLERGQGQQHDIETECLLYYDEVQRGVQARIRDSQWLLLSTFMQADGSGEPELSRLNPLSGKVDGILLGEGFAEARYIQRQAARLPVVVIAGTLGAQALPDAVVCANDQMAIGVLRALTAAGVRVPDKVAVTGFDDLYPARLVDPPLTTVRQPMHMLGEQACARLLDRIARPILSPTVQLLPTELVLRSSCGCPPGTVTRQPVKTLQPGLSAPVQGYRLRLLAP
jgi:DNA-binding LacI/PurR family transcriptional regulator